MPRVRILFHLDGGGGIRYTVMKTEGGVCMGYVAMIGLLFAPLICLLCCGWFYVRYQNEHDDARLAAKSRRICQGFLLAAYYDRHHRTPYPLLPEFLSYAEKIYLGGYSCNIVKDTYNLLKNENNYKI